MDAALDCYRQVVALGPNSTSCYNLGIKLYEAGYIDEAIKSFCHVISFSPEDSDTYYNLGLAFFTQKKYKESVVCLKKALEYGDNGAHTHYCLGAALRALEKISESILCHKKAVSINPHHLQAHLSLGSIYKTQGDMENAISSFQQALKIAPDNKDVLFNLASLYKREGNNSNAQDCYRQIIAIDPDNAKAYKNIGNTLHEQGFIEDAIKYYEKSLLLAPDPGLEVRSALALPVINKSKTTIRHYRQRLENKLGQLIDRNIKLTDPLTEVGNTSFLLAYHGLNDRDIQQKIAAFYLKTCPPLGWAAPHCRNLQASNGKIKIGFISTFLFSHTIAYLFFGIIEQLSKKDFHITVFRFHGKQDPMSQAIDKAADEAIKLPYELEEARKIIADSTLHILFYLDIGMEPLTYFLAFSRLAPVQCKRGHPVTSGIPNLDYFISCDKSETSDAEQHYSEQLIRLKTYGYYYYPPKAPTPLKQRSDFELPIDSTLYVCPQSLFKFHPDSDSIFGEILQKDPSGFLVLIQGREENWSKLLLDRFTLTFPNEIDRVIILDKMTNPDFLSLCLLADAVLDTPGFTGGKISLDCFALGIPIVTIPSQFMRGRLTFAQYELMEIHDCTARDENDFINLAIKLAHDRNWKTKISEKIKQRSHVLFNNLTSVKELELFFVHAVKHSLTKG